MSPPSVGRMVHYTGVRPTGDPVVFAAVIAEVYDAEAGDVRVHVFNPKVSHQYVRCQQASEATPGYWNWMPEEKTT